MRPHFVPESPTGTCDHAMGEQRKGFQKRPLLQNRRYCVSARILIGTPIQRHNWQPHESWLLWGAVEG